MNRIFKYIWSAFALAALASCSDDSTGSADAYGTNGDKELIALSYEGVTVTRSSSPKGFDKPTKVSLRFRATQANSDNVRYTEATAMATANITPSDSHSSILNANYSSGDHSDLAYETGQERYWDDAYGRDTKLTVYALAVPNKEDVALPQWVDPDGNFISATPSPNWYTTTTPNHKVSWSVSTIQNSDSMAKQDLVFSYNIRADETTNEGCYRYTYNSESSSWGVSMVTGEMKWFMSDGSTKGKFDQGHLVFTHALSEIEIVLTEGEGFDHSATTDFQWTNNSESATQNITLIGFNTSGKLEVSTAKWSDQASSNITTMYESSVTNTDGGVTTRTLLAYVVPETTLVGVNTNVVEFEIDKNKYYVTGDQIAKAIQSYTGQSSFTKLESGKHYKINMTVNKTKIDNITAAIVDWETVNSTSAEHKNTYCTFDFEDRSIKYVEADASKFQIYRAEKAADDYILSEDYASHVNAYAWGTGYTAATGKTWNGTKNAWEATNWYWPDNKTFYHFRAAGSTEGTIPGITTAENDYFEITSGALSGSNYKDYTWGAPFDDLRSPDTNDWDTGHPLLTYDPETNGFDGTTPHQISRAIAATEDTIQMLMFHMTSQIYVNVRTKTDASKVKLDDGAATPASATTVEILNFLPNGTVRMGNGLVTANTSDTRTTAATMTTGTYTAASGSEPDKVEGYSYGIVPQALSWSTPTTGTIGLRITTPDGNQYNVRDLSTITATSITSNNITNPYTNTSNVINAWYPGYSYTYTVTLKQKEIDRITAAVVPFETVEGNLGEINLEN